MPKPSNLRLFIIAFAIGILFGVPLGIAGFIEVTIFVVTTLIFCILILRKQLLKNSFLILIIIGLSLGLISGSLRAYFSNRISSEYAEYYDTHSELLLNIVSEPIEKNGFLQMTMQGDGLNQKIQVRMARSADPQFGERVIVSGTLHAPQPIVDAKTGAVFNYPGYLLSKGVTATESMPHAFLVEQIPHTPKFFLESLAYNLQIHAYANIFSRYQITIQPFLKALLFGDRGDLSKVDQEEFVRTGTIHLIAVSGFKLTILLLGLQAILQPFIRRKYLIIITIIIGLLYSAAFGFDPPVLRAAAMSTIFMLSEIAGGGYDPTATLIFLASVLAFLNPAAEAFDSSFLFSVLGVLGIIHIGPLIRNVLKRFIKFPGAHLFLRFFCPAAGAYFLTVPLSLYWYGEISLVMPITVLLIMPLFEPCILLGYASGFPVLGVLAAVINEPFLHYITWAVQKLAMLPFASIHTQLSGYLVYLIYACACTGYAYKTLKKGHGSATIRALPII